VSDGDACTEDLCDSSVGVVHIPAQTSDDNGCTTEHLPAWIGLVHGGYQFRSGFEIGGSVGYLAFGANARSNLIDLRVPAGSKQTASTGRFDELIRVSGVVFGVNAAQRFVFRERFPLVVRVGLGLVRGTVSDQRSGTFQTLPPLDVERSESPPFMHLYVTPEVRAGIRLAGHVDATIGVSAMVMRVLTDARWTNETLIVSPAGTGGFEDDRVLGKTVIILAPSLGVRYDFDAAR